jgi:hypothetical protein
LRSAVDILEQSDISSRDCEFVDGFLKTSNNSLTNESIHLKRRNKYATEFYKSVSKLSFKASAVSKKPEGFLPGVDNFLCSFSELWHNPLTERLAIVLKRRICLEKVGDIVMVKL